MTMLGRRIHDFLRDVGTLYFICRDPQMPAHAKALAIAIVAYAISPIDLLPDVIPALGFLDDFLVIPAGALLVGQLIPSASLAEHRRRADRLLGRLSTIGIALAIVAIWALGTILVAINLR